MRLLILASLLLVACQHAPARATQAGDDRAQSRAQLLATNREADARARQQPFVAILAGLFDSTGVYLAPAPLMAGPAGVRSWLGRDTLNARSTATWTVLHHDVSADGRDGYTYGYFDIARPSGDSVRGRYQAYWRRNARGEWRILAFSRGRREAGEVTLRVPDFVRQEVNSSPPALRDSAVVLREIFRTEGAFCDSVGTIGVGRAFVLFAAPTVAKFGGPVKFVFGPDAIATLNEGAPPGAGPAWEPQAGSVAASQDLGFTYGPAWNRQAPRPAETPGKYFTIWQRQPNGTWRYVID